MYSIIFLYILLKISPELITHLSWIWWSKSSTNLNSLFTEKTEIFPKVRIPLKPTNLFAHITTLFFFSHIMKEEVSACLSMTAFSNYSGYHVLSHFKNTNTVIYITLV